MTKDFDGVALRIPLVSGSIADVVVVTKRDTSAEEVNKLFGEEAKSDRYRGIRVHLAARDEGYVRPAEVAKVPRTRRRAFQATPV